MRVLAAAAMALLSLTASAHAACMPLRSDVVSLGQKAARYYSELSLVSAIDAEKERVLATGATLGPISKTMRCDPFPNLLGADEWRCVGEGKVCSK
jgi:hypothetical protein